MKAEEGTSRRRLLAAVAFAAVTVGALRPARAPAHTHELAAGARPHGARRRRWSALLRELRPPRARVAEAVSFCRPPGSGALPGRLRRRRRQRSCAPVPARLPGEDRHAAQAAAASSSGSRRSRSRSSRSASSTRSRSSRSRSRRPRRAPGASALPLIVVVLFGVCCCGLLVAGRHLAGLPFVARRRAWPGSPRASLNHPRSTTREAIAAWLFLLGCWTSRALGSTLLLAALGVGFSPAACPRRPLPGRRRLLIPIASGGAIANVSATAAVLLALGVHKEQRSTSASPPASSSAPPPPPPRSSASRPRSRYRAPTMPPQAPKPDRSRRAEVSTLTADQVCNDACPLTSDRLASRRFASERRGCRTTHLRPTPSYTYLGMVGVARFERTPRARGGRGAAHTHLGARSLGAGC